MTPTERLIEAVLAANPEEAGGWMRALALEARAELEAVPNGLTDVQQIAMALQPFGLAILKTAPGYKVQKLGKIEAYIKPDVSSVQRAPDGGDRVIGAEMRSMLSATPLPPAQQEAREVTPEMLKAAQLKSELGAYACSKLAGGYSLITELYEVMSNAAPAQQEALTDEQIDLIANDGMRNAAGGIYATRVYDFARAIERAHRIGGKQ